MKLPIQTVSPIYSGVHLRTGIDPTSAAYTDLVDRLPAESPSIRVPAKHEEVVARHGKNPLMKGKGLDLNAIKEARTSSPTAEIEAEAEEPDEAKDEKDLMGLLSSDESDD